MERQSTLSATGIILAGGLSRRMGRDKAWIKVGGRAMIERVAAALSTVCAELVLSTNEPESYTRLGLRMVGDLVPGQGSLGGLYAALLAASHDQAVVVACDMPLLNPALLRAMLSVAPGYDVVIPQAHDPSKPQGVRGRQISAKDTDLHPLHAVYSKRCLPEIKASLDAGDLRLISFLPRVHVRTFSAEEIDPLDPKHLSFFNINTPADLEYAARLV